MSWFLLALITAFLDAIKAAWSKRIIKDCDFFVLAWASRAFVLPLCFPLVIWEGLPQLGPSFWTATLVSAALNTCTTITFLRALQLSDLSVTMPLKAFAPLFLMLSSPILLGEVPGVWGTAGILTVISGSYLLELKERHTGLLGPLRVLFTSPGPKYMLLTTLLWGLCSNFNKIAVLDSSPIFFQFAIHVIQSILLLPLAFHGKKGFQGSLQHHWGAFVVLGTLGFLMTLCQWTALTLTLAVYVLSVKRLGGVFGVLIGRYFYKEEQTGARLFAAGLMTLGVYLILLESLKHN